TSCLVSYLLMYVVLCSFRVVPMSLRVVVVLLLLAFSSFFFNDTATTEIYTLSLHDALPIYGDADATLCIPRRLTGQGGALCRWETHFGCQSDGRPPGGGARGVEMPLHVSASNRMAGGQARVHTDPR